MSANTYLQVSELDFDEIRTNLKTYLSSQDQFKDYSFEGSAMAVLLDVLAYNTHYNAYYLNMVGNEMFLDTAQQRDSVVSRAKELGYTPVSSVGAQAEVSLTISGVDSTVTQITIPKNAKFTTTFDDVTYTYVNPAAKNIAATSVGVFTGSLTIKEGEPLAHSWTVSASNPVRYILKVDYLVNNGEETNGADSFSVDSLDIGTAYSSATITSVSSSALGGRPQETVESIKFQAPRNYQTQNRAVIASDYERILLSENPDLQSVIAFGGEQATPAVFGKVYIAVKPFGERFATQNRKQSIKTSIVDRTPLAVDPVIIDADYTYIIPTITTYYDVTKSSLNDSAVAANVRAAITTFSTTNLGRFGNKLRFSRFVRSLDDTSDGYVLNNDATIKIEKRVTPNLNVAELVSLRFNNAIRPGSMGSSEFTYNGFSAFLGDDGLGTISIFRYSDSKERVNIIPVAGTVDYVTGIVTIENFLPSAFSDLELRINVSPENLDIIPIREQILLLNSPDAIINVVGEQT